MGFYNKRGHHVVVGRDCVKTSPRDGEESFQRLTSPAAFPGQGTPSAMALADAISAHIHLWRRGVLYFLLWVLNSDC